MTKKEVKLQFSSSDMQHIMQGNDNPESFIKTESGYTLVVSAGQTINKAFQNLSLQLHQPAVALVNGITQDFSYFLEPGDTVKILFQISGG
jgi:hypothetical protein